jgi:hypothetical protein
MLSNSDWHIISNDDVPAVKIQHMLILHSVLLREVGREGSRKFPKKRKYRRKARCGGGRG